MTASAGRGADDGIAMSLTEHIRELRSRLVKAGLAVFAAVIVAFLLRDRVIDVLEHQVCGDAGISGVGRPSPQCPNGVLTLTGPTAGITLAFKVAFFGGVILSAPLWLYQAWAFMAPGLYKNEKRYGLGFLAAGSPTRTPACGHRRCPMWTVWRSRWWTRWRRSTCFIANTAAQASHQGGTPYAGSGNWYGLRPCATSRSGRTCARTTARDVSDRRRCCGSGRVCAWSPTEHGRVLNITVPAPSRVRRSQSVGGPCVLVPRPGRGPERRREACACKGAVGWCRGRRRRRARPRALGA